MEWTFGNVNSQFGFKNAPVAATVVGNNNYYFYANSFNAGANVGFGADGEILTYPQVTKEQAQEQLKNNKLPIYLIAINARSYYARVDSILVYVKSGKVVTDYWNGGSDFTIDLTTPLNGFMCDSRITTAHLTPSQFVT